MRPNLLNSSRRFSERISGSFSAVLAITLAEVSAEISGRVSETTIFRGKINGLAIKGPQMQKFTD
jgi:hypothetical protein